MFPGPSGMDPPGGELLNFSLILTGGGRAKIDSVSCDSHVRYALCGLRHEVPPAAFIAVIWFDVPTGENWTSVHFRYSNGVKSNVYVFPR